MSLETITIENTKAMAQRSQAESNLNRLKSLSKLKGENLTEEKKSQLAEASRGFESIFVNMMFKQMKQAMIPKKDDNGFGGDTMGDVAQMKLADQISNQGKGIGIAQMMYKQLTGENIPSKRSINPISEFTVNKTIEPSKSTESRLKNYENLIDNASSNYGIPKNLIKSVIAAESAGKYDAVSPAGAKGLMQLMDGTASSLGVSNPFDPKENVMGGTDYLNQMLNKYDGSLEIALAAYNAGPGNVDKYGGIPPFSETKSYIDRVLGYNSFFNNSELLGD